ncbi:retrovirus-related pol polyprotein from transposon TNT 1-94 [Tanacetum coccineum]
MASNEETNAAGTDTRPLMLVENDYESWKIRIHRYIRGKPNGKLIWKSIQNGPTPHPMITDPPPTGSTVVPAPRKKLDYEFNEEENKLEMADTQAEIILSQGRTLQQRKEDLFDEYECFRAIGNESIHDYFVRFHKLVNDMKITQLNIPTNQMNTKFFSSQPTAQSSNDALMATMTQIANLLSGFQKQFPPTNNQLRTSSNSKTHATVHDGQIVTEPVQRKAPGNVGNTGARGKKYFKDKMLLMEAKEKGATLDAEAEAFLADVECTAPYDQPLAMTTTNIFEVNHEDAYDSDVDESPNAAASFMANLSSTSATNSQVNEVHSNENEIFDNVNDQMIQEMQQEEHSDFDAENEIDENTISYDQYILDKEAQCVPTEISADTSDTMSMIAILTDLQTKLDGHAKDNQEICLDNEKNKPMIQPTSRNAELEQENVLLKSALSVKDKSITLLQSEKEKILSEKKELADSYLDEIVCLKNANKVARDMLQRFNMPTQTIPMLSKKPIKATDDLHKDILGTRNPGLGYMAKRAQPVLYDADTLLHPTHHPVSIWDSEEVLVHQVVSMKKMNEKPGHKELHKKPDYVSEWCYDYAKQFVEQQLVPFYEHFKKHIQSANETIFREVKEYEQIFDDLDAEYERCVLDNKNLTIEKKNLLIKNDCLIAECLEKDICSIVLTSDIVVPPSSNCLCEDLRSACDREHTKVLELAAEVLKQQKMVIESEKRNSHLQKTHIDLQLKFQNYKQCIDTSSGLHANSEINKLRKQLQGKDDTIRNLDAQISIMKVMNVCSTDGSCDQQALETDRIQLKDMITSLRIQLDGLKVENVSLKRRYDELSKANTHSRTAYTEKLSALTTQHTKLQAQVTGVKPTSGASKTVPKRAPRNHSSLPAKSANARRVEAHHRTLNKKKIVLILICLLNICKFQRDFCITNVSMYLETQDPHVHMTGDRALSCQLCIKDHWTLNELARNDLVRGLPMLKYDKDHLCPSCQLGKSKKASHPIKTTNTNTEVLHTLHMDLCGPMRSESINKKKYVLVIVDDYTRFGWVQFLQSKDETPHAIEKFIVQTQRALNATVRFVRTDNGTDNRTLIEAARTMLIFAKAPLFLWAEAVATACYTLNRSLVHTLHGKTYYELLKGKKPNLQYFRVFGSLCYPTNDYDDVGKLKAKADIGLTSVPNSTELELTALQSGHSHSELVKDLEPPSVPPTKKRVDDLFQWFDDDEVIPPPVVPIPPVNVHAAPAPENANGLPSTTVISEGAPAVTESLLPNQIPLPDTSDSDVETLFDHVDSNVFDTYIAPETDSEASSSNSVNIDVTPNNQLPHVQKWTQAHPLENIIGDKDQTFST